MPLSNITQPDILAIDSGLRLRKYDGKFSFALPWYQDAETLLLVDGKTDPYDLDRLERMYSYLDARGELYFIEFLQSGVFRPVGDVTLCRNDLPIVVGEASLRRCGIGRRVLIALIGRARRLGFPALYVDEIYAFNTGSARLFTACGFSAYESTEKGARYVLPLS
ncbi:MAG TPA: GNAT family N-acetyltransferase [Eubacteriales bacterium]|nr:GNAT family N-acetyltransferase [Eubacteriales bacterium]